SNGTSYLLLEHHSSTTDIHQASNRAQTKHAYSRLVGDERATARNKQMVRTHRRREDIVQNNRIRATSRLRAFFDETRNVNTVTRQQLVDVSRCHSFGSRVHQLVCLTEGSKELRHGRPGPL